MDVPPQMTNNYGFCMESKFFNNDSQLKVGGFTIPCQHPISYQPGCNASISRTDNVSPQSVLFSKKRTSPGENTALNNWKSSKRTKANALEQGLRSLAQEESAATQHPRLHVPARRSQRLGDKITALQKLVSPYGKTDTASVLQEACLYIKLLQEHIQNLLRMQSSSYKSLNPQEIGQKRQEDLRSKGLCLVPLTFTRKVTINGDTNDFDDSSRNIIMPHNF